MFSNEQYSIANIIYYCVCSVRWSRTALHHTTNWQWCSKMRSPKYWKLLSVLCTTAIEVYGVDVSNCTQSGIGCCQKTWYKLHHKDSKDVRRGLKQIAGKVVRLDPSLPSQLLGVEQQSWASIPLRCECVPVFL